MFVLANVTVLVLSEDREKHNRKQNVKQTNKHRNRRLKQTDEDDGGEGGGGVLDVCSASQGITLLGIDTILQDMAQRGVHWTESVLQE